MFHSNIFRKITTSSLLAFMVFGYGTATTEKSIASGQTDVTAELMLSIDVSGSVNTSEYNLQMDGYAAAFRDRDVINTIKSLPEGLAVGVQFWATRPKAAEPWRVLKTEQDSKDFANYLDTLARPRKNTRSLYKWGNKNKSIGSGTNVTGAITAATSSITTNKYNGDVLVIDVSGDGKSNWNQYNGKNSKDGSCGGGNNNCQGVKNARDAAVALGITINGLPIENNSSSTTITNYYNAHVKGGTKGFVETAGGFDDFARAAKEKIYQEVSAALSPDAQDDNVDTTEDSAVNYNVIAGNPSNNAGQDIDPNGDTLTVTKFVMGGTEYTFDAQNTTETINLANGATLTVKSNGDVNYDPTNSNSLDAMNPGETATETFTYTVSDPYGYTDTADVIITVNGRAEAD